MLIPGKYIKVIINSPLCGLISRGQQQKNTISLIDMVIIFGLTI